MPSVPRVYPILDVELTRARHLSELDLARIWLDAGVELIQLRAKKLASGALLDLIDALVQLTRPGGARVIVNDRADLAVLGSADGVHVGQGDLAPSHARAIVGPSRIVGYSTHTVGQVEQALAEPVDYLAFGPVFQTMSKEAPDPVVGLDSLTRVSGLAARAGKPVVAIGGITLTGMPDVFAAGASSVAVISDLLVGDPAQRIRAYLKTT